jgi:DNA-binding NarL/FixJ family response regulator
MNILIVDDHVLFREGLISLLSNHPDVTVVGEADTVHEAVAKIVKLKPDVVLMEVHLPDGDGVDAIREILSRRPETKIAILTHQDSDDSFISAIRSGARGYLPKKMPISKLLLSLGALERGEVAMSRSLASRIVTEFQKLVTTNSQEVPDLAILTPREREILQLLANQGTNQEIAEYLVISENTVKVHVHNILEKLNLKNRREAIKFARHQGNDNTNHGSSHNGS